MLQVYIANNPSLVSLAGANTSTAAAGTLKTVGKQLTIGGNPALTSLAGLESLEYVGGTVSLPAQHLIKGQRSPARAPRRADGILPCRSPYRRTRG